MGKELVGANLDGDDGLLSERGLSQSGLRGDLRGDGCGIQGNVEVEQVGTAAIERTADLDGGQARGDRGRGEEDEAAGDVAADLVLAVNTGNGIAYAALALDELHAGARLGRAKGRENVAPDDDGVGRKYGEEQQRDEAALHFLRIAAFRRVACEITLDSRLGNKKKLAGGLARFEIAVGLGGICEWIGVGNT